MTSMEIDLTWPVLAVGILVIVWVFAACVVAVFAREKKDPQ